SKAVIERHRSSAVSCATSGHSLGVAIQTSGSSGGCASAPAGAASSANIQIADPVKRMVTAAETVPRAHGFIDTARPDAFLAARHASRGQDSSMDAGETRGSTARLIAGLLVELALTPVMLLAVPFGAL